MGDRTVLEFTGPDSLVHGHPLSSYNMSIIFTTFLKNSLCNYSCSLLFGTFQKVVFYIVFNGKGHHFVISIVVI